MPQNSKYFYIFIIAESEICPIGIFKLYLSKLNKKRPDLWQPPKFNIKEGHADEWYDNQVIGRDPLNETMKNLSTRAKLSTIYTNHCIQASTVTQLVCQGFEARHIMKISVHKSENSIKNYASACPDTKKREMFEALATNINTEVNQIGNESRKKEDNNAQEVPQEVDKLQNLNYYHCSLIWMMTHLKVKICSN